MSLEDLSKDILKMAASFKDGKEAKKFMKKASNKLKKKTVNTAKTKVKEKTGRYIESIKSGKVYKNSKDSKSETYKAAASSAVNQSTDSNGNLAVRVYTASPHGHLIEHGHIIKDKTGKKHDFKKGYYVFEESAKEYEEEFYKGVEDLIDKVISESGF